MEIDPTSGKLGAGRNIYVDFRKFFSFKKLLFLEPRGWQGMVLIFKIFFVLKYIYIYF